MAAVTLRQVCSKFLQLSSANHHSMLIYHRLLRCVKALTRQHIITSSVFKLRTGSLTQHLASYGVRKFAFSFSLKYHGNKTSFPHEELIMWSHEVLQCLKSEFWHPNALIETFIPFTKHSFIKSSVFCCWYLVWLILRPSRWRWHVPPKHQFTFNGLYSIISQKIELFITTAMRTSNPTFFHHVNIWCTVFPRRCYNLD
jgi:hypothetical protein